MVIETKSETLFYEESYVYDRPTDLVSQLIDAHWYGEYLREELLN